MSVGESRGDVLRRRVAHGPLFALTGTCRAYHHPRRSQLRESRRRPCGPSRPVRADRYTPRPIAPTYKPNKIKINALCGITGEVNIPAAARAAFFFCVFRKIANSAPAFPPLCALHTPHWVRGQLATSTTAHGAPYLLLLVFRS